MFVLAADEYQRMSAAAAGGLRARGLTAGDRVAIVTPEHRFPAREAARLQACVVAVVGAALRTGLVPVPVNPLLTPGEQAHIVADSGAAAVLAEAADLIGLVEHEGPAPDLADWPLGRPMHYTSGTTGRPKGVYTQGIGEALTEALWRDELDQWDFTAADTTLVHGPLCHAAPLRYAMLVLQVGGTAVLPGVFDAPAVARAMHEHRPTHAFMVPSHLQRLFGLDLPPSPYRLVTHAGAACPPALKRRLHAWAGVEHVWEFYGSTEGQFTVCPGVDWESRPGTVGRARPGRTLEVRDGVIWCRTPDFARFAYWDDPDKTAAAWDGDAFSVGDLGRLDDGFLYLEGRREDLIISGGVNVYPAEVEAVLAECPGVREVAAFGRDDEQWGQRVCVAYSGHAQPGEVAAWAATRLAGYKRPKQIEQLDALPHNASGKVERLALAMGVSR
ncbi:MAG TPA: AMP-binding protein [Actinomycetota bacterium]|nr:AMP-binding protein [Actinomycetota bacterium]